MPDPSSICPALRVGSPRQGYAALAATKASTDALTRVLALELHGRDITVNAEALDVDRPCPPGRVAHTLTYLLGADGHRLTGEVIGIDEPR
jgi:hypothetical protein